MILADMGAEVIKIERPGVGERGRANGPFIDGPDGQRISSRYLGLNRNKKSVTLDLRDPRCKQAFERIAANPTSCWTTGAPAPCAASAWATTASRKSTPA